jgi:hypothetical protein
VAQIVDLAAQAAAVVGRDALQHLNPVLQRAQFGLQLRIFGCHQLQPLQRLVVLHRLQRLAPAAFQRIAVLDPEPGGENPATNGRE